MPDAHPVDPYTSSDTAEADYTADQAFTFTRAQRLIDLAAYRMQMPSGFGLVTNTTNTQEPSWGTLDTLIIVTTPMVPTSLASVLHVLFNAVMDAGTGNLRLVVSGGTTGSSVGVTTVSGEKELTTGDESGQTHPTRLTVTIQGNVNDSANTLTATMTDNSSIFWGV